MSKLTAINILTLQHSCIDDFSVYSRMDDIYTDIAKLSIKLNIQFLDIN